MSGVNADERLPQRTQTDGIGRLVGLALLMIVLAHVAVFAEPWLTVAIGVALAVALLVGWQVSARRSRQGRAQGRAQDVEDVRDVRDVKDSGSPRPSGWPERGDR
jgi:MFS superfamily sulfate permease-like transporter